MTRACVSILAALGLLLPGSALADPGAVYDFELHALPPPSSLRMRRQVDPSTPAAPAMPTAPVAGQPAAESGNAAEPGDTAASRTPVSRVAPVATSAVGAQSKQPDPGSASAIGPAPGQVVFRFNLGVGLDGGAPARENGMPVPLLGGAQLGDNYARLRIYYFGDAVIGSRGVMAPSLTTYLAAQFRFDQDFGQSASAVPTIHDATIGDNDVNDLWIRSAYATSDGFFDQPLLKPLYVRAGRQYRYGPAIAHFDGITVGYDNDVVTMAVFAGRSVDVTGYPVSRYLAEDASISGLDARLDFNALKQVPLVWQGGFLRFDGHTHFEGSVALQWNPDVALRAGLRIMDSAHARTHLQMRARISRVTTLNIEFENRSITDWMYDLFTVNKVSYSVDGSDPRTYINLGDPNPRMYLNLRAGTVLLDNVDVLVHGGAAILRRVDEFVANAHSAGYVEVGSAVEVRLRRTVGLGLSVLGRRYKRDEPKATAQDVILAEPVSVDTGSVGERSFAEAGTTLRYTQGARKLSAGAELYARYYDFQSSYLDVDPVLLDQYADFRGGGRFSVEAWAGENLRIKAEYDVSTTLSPAPELRGIKSLRVLAEGRF